MIRALIAGLLLCVAQAAPARLIEYRDFASKQVAPRHVSVWVPDDYDPHGPRLPVIYMHDGQNLFEPGHAYGGAEWGVDEAMVARGGKAIVVGVWNTSLRGREYLPAKPVARLPAATQARIEAVHGGASLADAYLRFLVTELKPFIDRHYRTRRGPRDTSIMGSSMGGLISLYALGEYPRVFGQAACLSIHWPLANPADAPPSEAQAVTDAMIDWLAHSRVRPGHNRLYVDHGSLNLDSYYRRYSEKIETRIPALGWRRDRDWRSLVFPGSDHNETSWRARLATPLTFLLDERTR